MCVEYCTGQSVTKDEVEYQSSSGEHHSSHDVPSCRIDTSTIVQQVQGKVCRLAKAGWQTVEGQAGTLKRHDGQKAQEADCNGHTKESDRQHKGRGRSRKQATEGRKDRQKAGSIGQNRRRIVPVMNSSLIKRSKKLSNWLSLRLAKARMSILLSGFPVRAISSSTTAANL